MAKPVRARIRNYNVGFGDCFLLTFMYAGDKNRNVLIDFGSTKKATAAPKGGMLTIARKIAEDCGDKLDVVVATHRHADHISGFDGAPGKVIASLKPELVIQPWTEDPDLEPDARAPAAAASAPDGHAALVARLADMHAVAQATLEQIPKLKASPSVRRTVREQLEFLGETNIKNEGAVENLMTMGQRPAVYASFGDEPPLGDLLPGVKVEVLGPPTLEQSEEIATQRHTDQNEFWHLAAASAGAARAGRRSAQPLFPAAPIASHTPQEARWVIPEIDRMRTEEMLAIVRSLDGALNNTSLILLFEVGKTRLLFPGDAQIENWNYALKGAPNRKAIKKRLASANFYKVGHHGSLNATPKTLWETFDHRSEDAKAAGRLTTMVSTAKGKHGSDDRGTEVPRKPLIEALTQHSHLYDTEAITSTKEFWNDVEFDF